MTLSEPLGPCISATRPNRLCGVAGPCDHQLLGEQGSGMRATKTLHGIALAL
jgi:hypothetical protein